MICCYAVQELSNLLCLGNFLLYGYTCSHPPPQKKSIILDCKRSPHDPYDILKINDDLGKFLYVTDCTICNAVWLASTTDCQSERGASCVYC